MADDKMNIYDKLTAIQNKLKVPKDLHNSFGNYNYRNAESIFEAVKPWLDEYRLSLTISDEVIAVGDRIYIKAIATLKDCESDDEVSAVAYAREAAMKKGMDDSQVTGATSSYARKYALNGLFLLDDSKDADSDEYQKTQNKAAEREKKKAKESQSDKYETLAPRKALVAFCNDFGIDINAVCQACSLNNASADGDFKAALEYARGLVR